MNWIVYIIKSKSGKLYTGITTNLERRIKEHCSEKKGAKFFRMSPPDEILFQENHNSRSDASKRECAIKKLTRKQKFELIFKK
ncbi:GIY-YIG nuclease family protein [Fluviispira multicolorata]|uniref:GIY-YIG nuclease family protein n=1 Tax=Fluviispira multicolorata TaxID=2654512 RepID=A0A833JCY5_9BACT|nr:GIY-YIG nuclease family protein [Fluviispira multicolorata]KAB8027772.1 GIY-YIG nuclease family protein [Fluviispira multicolorata]